jgi:hypothetical protein
MLPAEIAGDAAFTALVYPVDVSLQCTGVLCGKGIRKVACLATISSRFATVASAR